VFTGDAEAAVAIVDETAEVAEVEAEVEVEAEAEAEVQAEIKEPVVDKNEEQAKMKKQAEEFESKKAARAARFGIPVVATKVVAPKTSLKQNKRKGDGNTNNSNSNSNNNSSNNSSNNSNNNSTNNSNDNREQKKQKQEKKPERPKKTKEELEAEIAKREARALKFGSQDKGIDALKSELRTYKFL